MCGAWLVAALVMPGAAARAQGTAEDRAAVRRAVLDYVEGFYEGDTTKLARSIRPQFYKYGFSRPRDSTRYAGMQMTWQQALDYAGRVRQSGRPTPASARKEVELLDVLDQTASAKLSAWWGVDYLLLAKYDGRWMISHVLWQSPPRPAPSPDPARGSAPEEFAAGTISDGNVYRGAFAPDGRTLYFFKKVGGGRAEDYRIYASRLAGGRWTAPERVALGGEHSDLYPAVSPDGRRLVFASYRPVPGDSAGTHNAHLWYAERAGEGWGPPVFMARTSALGQYHSAITFTADGALHFQTTAPDWETRRGWIARWDGAEFGPPQPYDPAEPWRRWRPDLYVWGARPAPDNAFALLEVSRVDSATKQRLPSDLWVTYRQPGTPGWSEPRPLGAGVNSAGTENFPFLSPDGRDLYFVRDFARVYRVPVAEALRGTK